MAFWKARSQPPVTGVPGLAEEDLASLGSIVGLDQLLEHFSGKLREGAGAKTVYVALHEPITNRYVGRMARGENTERLQLFDFSRADNLIRWLNVNHCPLDVLRNVEILRFLSPQEQQLLRATDTVLVVPLVVLNHLTGVLFVEGRTDLRPFTPQEIDVISWVASRSALAIEHAKMHEFQEERLKKILHSDKLASVGELAAGVAHEIRNPLTSIRSTMQHVEKGLPEDKRRLVEGLIGEVDRIDQIIEGLLSFSKTSDLEVSPVNIVEIVEQTLLLLESELKKHSVGAEMEGLSGGAWVLGDASQLKQVFLNIMLNSLQALDSGGGNIIVTVRKAENRPRTVSAEIRDTGIGITGPNLAKVFDPFYTTKRDGTGLGLSISYGIISKHGGEIDIQSHTEGPQRGTTVTVHLPQALSPGHPESS